MNAQILSCRKSRSCHQSLSKYKTVFEWKDKDIIYTNQLQFHFHLATYVDRLLAHLLDGEQLALVQTDGCEDRRVPEIGVRIRAETHLTGADQRMSGLCVVGGGGEGIF